MTPFPPAGTTRADTRAAITALLASHHPHALPTATIARLLHIGVCTTRNYLRVMEGRGLVHVRDETPNERTRRGAKSSQHVWGLVEQRPPSTWAHVMTDDRRMEEL